MRRTTLCKYILAKNNNKKKLNKKLPAFETDVNNRIYIMTVTGCFCLVYLSDSL